jgi:hypothetical protein
LTFRPGVSISESFLPTKEEQEQQERDELERIDKGNAVLDATLRNLWACKACGEGNCFASQSGLCASCAAVVVQLKAEARGRDLVNGQSRRDLCALWLEAFEGDQS